MAARCTRIPGGWSGLPCTLPSAFVWDGSRTGRVLRVARQRWPVAGPHSATRARTAEPPSPSVYRVRGGMASRAQRCRSLRAFDGVPRRHANAPGHTYLARQQARSAPQRAGHRPGRRTGTALAPIFRDLRGVGVAGAVCWFGPWRLSASVAASVVLWVWSAGSDRERVQSLAAGWLSAGPGREGPACTRRPPSSMRRYAVAHSCWRSTRVPRALARRHSDDRSGSRGTLGHAA
jgi:hypothetical protein